MYVCVWESVCMRDVSLEVCVCVCVWLEVYEIKTYVFGNRTDWGVFVCLFVCFPKVIFFVHSCFYSFSFLFGKLKKLFEEKRETLETLDSCMNAEPKLLWRESPLPALLGLDGGREGQKKSKAKCKAKSRVKQSKKGPTSSDPSLLSRPVTALRFGCCLPLWKTTEDDRERERAARWTIALALPARRISHSRQSVYSTSA